MQEFIKEYGEENKDNKELLYNFVFKNINRILGRFLRKALVLALLKQWKSQKKFGQFTKEKKERILFAIVVKWFVFILKILKRYRWSRNYW